MAPPRTFSYDLLKRLVREHPEWPYADYADVLTADVRKTNPRAKRILPQSVRRVVSQYGDRWREEGVSIPSRGIVHADLMPPLGSVAPSERMSTPLRYLREISQERRGEAPFTDHARQARRQALRWEARLRERREITDLTDRGRVIVRPARADELGRDGQLLELAAWALPGWEPRPRVNARQQG
jgi:hypothetical protein